MAGVVGTFLGVTLLTPALVKPLAAALSPVLSFLFGIEGKMAAANAARNPGRTALTASALMVGVSLVVAFSARSKPTSMTPWAATSWRPQL